MLLKKLRIPTENSILSPRDLNLSPCNSAVNNNTITIYFEKPQHILVLSSCHEINSTEKSVRFINNICAAFEIENVCSKIIFFFFCGFDISNFFVPAIKCQIYYYIEDMYIFPRKKCLLLSTVKNREFIQLYSRSLHNCIRYVIQRYLTIVVYLNTRKRFWSKTVSQIIFLRTFYYIFIPLWVILFHKS